MANSFGNLFKQFASAFLDSVVKSQSSKGGSGRSSGKRGGSGRQGSSGARGSSGTHGSSGTRSPSAQSGSRQQPKAKAGQASGKSAPKPAPPASRAKQSGAQQSSTGQAGAQASSSAAFDSSAGTQTARSAAQLPKAGDIPKVYSVKDLGMPDFEYTPAANSRPDPGEVVWTWVPYEEDRSQGKDRPVVVVAEIEERIIFAQLTSKDHDAVANREARSGRMWIDVGTGSWDSQGRPSEARIDRLLCVHPDQMRREGGRLDESRFTEVIAAIRAYHG